MDTLKKRPGRPKGSKTDPAKIKRGTRPGSIAHTLVNMKPGTRVFLEAPRGALNRFQIQLSADMTRNKLNGKFTQTLVLGIEPRTREVHELVMVTRKAELVDFDSKEKP